MEPRLSPPRDRHGSRHLRARLAGLGSEHQSVTLGRYLFWRADSAASSCSRRSASSFIDKPTTGHTQAAADADGLLLTESTPLRRQTRKEPSACDTPRTAMNESGTVLRLE